MPDSFWKYIEDHFEGPKAKPCRSRVEFIDFLRKECSRERHSQGDPKPLEKGQPISPLKRAVFEIEALLHNVLHSDGHNDLRIWMLYLSRHKIKELSTANENLLSPAKYRPWDGFDALVRPEPTYSDNDKALQPGQLRSWRCFRKFFMDDAGSFVLEINPSGDSDASGASHCTSKN